MSDKPLSLFMTRRETIKLFVSSARAWAAAGVVPLTWEETEFPLSEAFVQSWPTSADPLAQWYYVPIDDAFLQQLRAGKITEEALINSGHSCALSKQFLESPDVMFYTEEDFLKEAAIESHV